MIFPSPILRLLLIACLWASPVPLHGEEDNQELRKRAEQGDADAQFMLAKHFALVAKVLGEKYAEKYNAGAVQWYRKAAELGHSEAQYNLGICYSVGTGVVKDEAEAVKWYLKAAEQGFAKAQYNLGICYSDGTGVIKNKAESLKWFSKDAEQGCPVAQYNLGHRLYNGMGVLKNQSEAVKWYRKAAEQGLSEAQFMVGLCYDNGAGVLKDEAQAFKWYLKSAEQNGDNARYAQNALGSCYLLGKGVVQDKARGIKWITMAAESGLRDAQKNLGNCYDNGDGVVPNPVESYKWMLLAAAQGDLEAKSKCEEQEERFSKAELIEGRFRAQNWESKKLSRDDSATDESRPEAAAVGDEPKATGTGFMITRDGYLVTNHHVVEGCSKVRVQTSAGLLDAVVVRMDDTTDLALLKVAGTFEALPVVSSRSTRLGATVATVGFPNVGLQGFEPKLSKGDISSLAGIQDDVRYFQISVPVQPGNSGGALVDELGNVVGVVSAQLSQKAALESTGTLAQSVNYAVKSSYLLSFLEAVPEANAEMPDAKTHEQKFEAVVDDVKKATVLIIGY